MTVYVELSEVETLRREASQLSAALKSVEQRQKNGLTKVLQHILFSNRNKKLIYRQTLSLIKISDLDDLKKYLKFFLIKKKVRFMDYVEYNKLFEHSMTLG